MREASFILSVHRHVPATVHVQGMTSASMTHSGTPDYYYDQRFDLWVEYKRFDKLGVYAHPPSKAQLLWLNRRYTAGGNACLIVGWEETPRKRFGMVLEAPALWERERFDRADVLAMSVPVADIAAYIVKRTLDASHRQSSSIPAAQHG
jgi:hypothetical protein